MNRPWEIMMNFQKRIRPGAAGSDGKGDKTSQLQVLFFILFIFSAQFWVFHFLYMIFILFSLDKCSCSTDVT